MTIAFGIDVGGITIKAAAVAASGAIVDRRNIDTPLGPGNVIEDAIVECATYSLSTVAQL